MLELIQKIKLHTEAGSIWEHMGLFDELEEKAKMKRSICSSCGGAGARSLPWGSHTACKKCGGHGYVSLNKFERKD